VQPKPQSCIEFLYEQLRKETDGASESMTHNDAIEIIRVWRDAYYAQKYPQPEQRPVATLWQHNETGRTRITMPGDITDCDARWFKAADLYTQPQAWVGLSDADLADCSTDEYKAARYWEAVLQEKNTKDQPS
jgi:hypothetical protein